jgi:hypothetical protein
MQLALGTFVVFCAWLFSPAYNARARTLDLNEVDLWGGLRSNGESPPAAWRGLYYMRPDGNVSPLIGMDTTLCAFVSARRTLSCPVASLLWAAREDSAHAARTLGIARFRYDLVFDEKYEAASIHAFIFGIELLHHIGMVWDIAKAATDGNTLRRCAWTADSVKGLGATPLERVRRAARGTRSCYRPRRVAQNGLVSAGVMRDLRQAWGSTVVRFESLQLGISQQYA